MKYLDISTVILRKCHSHCLTAWLISMKSIKLNVGLILHKEINVRYNSTIYFAWFRSTASLTSGITSRAEWGSIFIRWCGNKLLPNSHFA